MADRPRVFVSRRIPDQGLDQILAECDATVWPDDLPPARDQLLSAVEGCDGILTLLTDRVDAELLDRAGPRLKVVSNYAVGYDNIVVSEATVKTHVSNLLRKLGVRDRVQAVIAAYDSAVSFGQERVLVCWNRLIRPDGVSISLECMPGVDLAGSSGFTDEVNHHWWRIVTGVALGTSSRNVKYVRL